MADVCSVLGGAGRKILNLIKGNEIEPATQHRSHCTPPHNSREHDERPMPQYVSPTNLDKTQARGGLVGPLRQKPDLSGALEQVQTQRTFCADVWRLKRALNIDGTPQTLRNAERTLKSALKRARIRWTPLRTDLTPKEVHLLNKFWGNSHHMPPHHPEPTCQP